MNKIPIIASIALCLLTLTCKHTTESPPPPQGADTTSHNFIWKAEIFGEASSNVFEDVAIINDSLAYAVGEIYLLDSTGTAETQPHNLAKWDGRGWQLYKIQFYGYCNQPQTYAPPITGIFAFTDSVIWLSHFNQVATWNGRSQTNIMCSPIDIYRMWGRGPQAVYTVGAQGQVGYFNGTTWKKLAGGTTPLTYRDIWGDINGQSATVIGVASDLFVSRDRLISLIDSNNVTTLSDSSILESLYGVWFTSDKSYYVVGSGIFSKTRLTEKSWSGGPGIVTNIFTRHIRGSGINDVMTVGDFGDVNHFNGSTWHNFSELKQNDRVLYRVAVKGKCVFAVGIQGNRALVLRGEHIN